MLTGTYDLPWDMQLGGKLVLATPTPFYANYVCDNKPRPGCSLQNGVYLNSIGGDFGGWVALTPHQFLGYKDLDLQVTKNFTLPEHFSAYARVDVINVFNWHNYNDVRPAARQQSSRVGARYNTIGPSSGRRSRSGFPRDLGSVTFPAAAAGG